MPVLLSCGRNTETLVHLLKGSLGTGILAMPNAFFKAGLIVGVIGTALIGSLCTYCIHVLVSAPAQLLSHVTCSGLQRNLRATTSCNRNLSH
jgi:hypothetical protein